MGVGAKIVQGLLPKRVLTQDTMLDLLKSLYPSRKIEPLKSMRFWKLDECMIRVVR